MWLDKWTSHSLIFSCLGHSEILGGISFNTYLQRPRKKYLQGQISYLNLGKVSDEHIWAGQINHAAMYWHISAGQITKRQYIEIFADIWHWVWQGEAEPGKFNVAESPKSQLLVPRSLLGLGGQCVASVCKSEADLEFLPKMSWCRPRGEAWVTNLLSSLVFVRSGRENECAIQSVNHFNK